MKSMKKEAKYNRLNKKDNKDQEKCLIIVSRDYELISSNDY